MGEGKLYFPFWCWQKVRKSLGQSVSTYLVLIFATLSIYYSYLMHSIFVECIFLYLTELGHLMGKELNPAKRKPCNKRNHDFTPFQQKYKHNTKIFPWHFECKTWQRVYNITIKYFNFSLQNTQKMCFVGKKQIILFLRVWQTESADLQTFIYLSNQTDEICTNLTRHRGVICDLDWS